MTLNLSKRLADARDVLHRASREVPAALLSGDEKQLRAKRKERDDAEADVADIEAAIKLADERKAREKEEAESKRRSVALSEARKLAEERIKVAAEIDQALLALEAVIQKHQSFGRALAIKMVEAGLRDSGRIGRSVGQNLRWSMWQSAEITAELLGVPFANEKRRETLEELARKTTPFLGKDTDEKA